MILTYAAAYLASYIFSYLRLYTASAAVLMAEAVVLYRYEYRRTGRLLNLAGLYSLSLVGGQGIACLKLSYLQTDWEIMTWLCFFAAYVCFRLGMRLAESMSGRKASEDIDEAGSKRTHEVNDVSVRQEAHSTYSTSRISRAAVSIRRVFSSGQISYKRLLAANCALALVSWAAFAYEACALGYIPLLVRGVPHAYSYFHISGVHYFTVSCVLCPAFSLMWHMRSDGRLRERIAAVLAALSGIVIPFLCVSRFQLVFAVMLCLAVRMVMLENRGHIGRRLVMRAACISVPLLAAAYVMLTAARSHDAEYLMGIFEMKADYPVVFSHFYIYIANNFENFNCMVRDLTHHTLGICQLYPLWAFTGLKYVYPQLVLHEYFLTKKELTTLTLFYDAYYDFGIIGVALLALLIGAAARSLEERAFKEYGACSVMLYGQFAIYMALAFFTTWLSNPTTWFYIGMTCTVCAASLERK